MSKSSAHIKQESLRNIVLQDGDCESKLSKIRDLIGLPPISDSLNQSEKFEDSEEPEKDLGSVTEVENDLKSDSIKRILDGLEGRELNIARNLINELQIAQISWHANTLELIVNEKAISHSNLGLLVRKVVHQSSPSLPLGLVTFINELVLKKVPINYIRDSDSLNIREAILMLSAKPDSDDQNGKSIEESKGLKRRREDEGSEVDFQEDRKKQKVDDDIPSEENEVTSEREARQEEVREEQPRRKRKFMREEVPTRASKRIRLKKSLQDSWSEIGK